MDTKLEVWQRGPVPNVPALLQPVAHALLQASEEAERIMEGFPEELMWEMPAGAASPAFHLQHLTGVINRLFTYARKESLNAEQLKALSIEGKQKDTEASLAELLQQFSQEVNAAVRELSGVDENTLTEVRTIGRRQIPTTLLGLYFHAAEHSMRHIGQLLVTVKVLKSQLNQTGAN